MNNNRLSFIKSFFFCSLNSINKKKLESLKNKHDDKRCFIIGNGPSLLKQDLVLLKNEFTFVSNRFILHEYYDQISPDVYCIGDNHFIDDKKEGQGILNNIIDKSKSKKLELFFPLQWKYKSWQRQIKFPKNTNYILFKSWDRIWENKTFSFNITNGISWGHTIIIDFCLPLAMYMGFKEIYLLGCDMSYGKDGKKTHFFSDRGLSKQRAGNDSREYWNKAVSFSYEMVKNKSKENGIQIYNATHGGYLEVFSRKNYEKIF